MADKAEQQPSMGGRVGKLIMGGGVVGILISVAAHYSPGMLKASGPAGAAVALVFGLLWGIGRGTSMKTAAGGGAITGAGCALLGILAGYLMGDQRAVVLVAGTVGGAVSGTIGGLIGGMISKKRQTVIT